MNYPRALLVAYAATVVLALLVAGTTSSAAFGAYNPAWDGASDLRAEADAVGAEPTVVRDTSAYGAVPARNTVAVVLSPDRAYGNESSGHLRSFVRDGGTLVVAEDVGPHGDALLADVGARARFDGRLLRDERHNHRSPVMPVATNVSNTSLAGGAEQVTLNYGTAVEPNGSTVAVATSGFAYLDGNRNGELDEDEQLRSRPVVTVEQVGAGRVVAVGDPSLLINAMLERPGNRALVRGLLDGEQRVLLDYSHAERLPPLALARLTVQRTPWLFLLLGLATVLGVAAWSRGTGLRQWLPGTGASVDLPERVASEDALVRYLSERHPDWDGDRIERVVRTARSGGDDRRESP